MWRCTAALTLGYPGHPLSVSHEFLICGVCGNPCFPQSQISRICQNHLLNGLREELNGEEFAREHTTSWLKDLPQAKHHLAQRKWMTPKDTESTAKRPIVLHGSSTASLFVHNLKLSNLQEKPASSIIKY